MIKIQNRLSQPLVANQGNGRVLHLLAGGKAVVDEADLDAAEIRELLDKGYLSAELLAPPREAAAAQTDLGHPQPEGPVGGEEVATEPMVEAISEAQPSDADEAASEPDSESE